MALTLSSSSFKPSGKIPKKHTCEGQDLSPPLEWSGAPGETRSFALIVDDPDAPDPAAPQRTWVHWVVVDLPESASSLAEDSSRTGLGPGPRQGKNDWNNIGWGGPCPPIGRHRYFFKLYALDTKLANLMSPTKREVELAMEGHVLEKAELIGTYQKGD